MNPYYYSVFIISIFLNFYIFSGKENLQAEQIAFLELFQSDGDTVIIDGQPLLRLTRSRSCTDRMILLYTYSTPPKQWVKNPKKPSKKAYTSRPKQQPNTNQVPPGIPIRRYLTSGSWSDTMQIPPKNRYQKTLHGKNHTYDSSINELYEKVKELFPDQNNKIRQAIEADIATLKKSRKDIVALFLGQFDNNLNILKNKNTSHDEKKKAHQFCFSQNDSGLTNGCIYFDTKKTRNNLPDQVTQTQWGADFGQQINKINWYDQLFVSYLPENISLQKLFIIYIAITYMAFLGLKFGKFVI